MKPAENIERVLENMNVTPDPDRNRRILAAALQAQAETQKQPPVDSTPGIWRTIMKSKLAKFAVAAVLFVIAFFLLQSVSAPVALAIDRTVQTIGKLETLHVAGIYIGEEGRLSEVEIWTRAHSENVERSGDFREEVKDTRISVASEAKNITYRYFPANHQVHIMAGLQNSVKPFWPDGDFFRQLRENAIDWQEVPGKDKNGNECITVTCSYILDRLPDRYFIFWMQFDSETMLPVRMKIRDLSKTRGPQEYYFDVIEFNQPLPDRLFEFDIPEGAEVIDER